MKVAIVGSRTFNNYELAEQYIDAVAKARNDEITQIISGGAKGADAIGEIYAKNHNIETSIFKPEWDKYGKSAGYRRNVDIINACDICIAFWDGQSKGTKHDIELCWSSDKPVYICNF